MRAVKLFLALAVTILVTASIISAQDASADADTQEAPPATYDAYTVLPGDSLIRIAQRFNTTVDELLTANGISADQQLRAGQTLLVPTGQSAFVEVYDVKPGDTMFSIAKRFNTSVDALKTLNEIPDERQLQAGRRIIVPSIDSTELDTYVVNANDSLFSISKRYNTNVTVLKSLNGIADEKELEAGQTILVPRIDETDFEIYEVTAGDSLYSISKRFATTEDALMSLNGIADPREIEVGQTLLVPQVDETVYDVYTVHAGDSLFDISRIYNTTVSQLRALNGIEGRLDLTVGRSILVPLVDEALLDRYIVQPGDSLYSIARRYNISLTALQALNQLADVRAIRVDQAILVPKLDNAVLEVHVVQRGDTLAKIADAYDTSVEFLQSINGLADPSLIRLDETILVPITKDVLVRPGFGFGIQVFTDAPDIAAVAKQVTELGVNWVKIDVRWSALEPEPGLFNYASLDSMLAALELAGLNILLNIYDAPDWSRATYIATLNSSLREYGGPPEDYDTFATFLANLVTRYAGVVDAYEIWKSPNLVKFWTVPVYHRSPERTDDGDYGIPDEINLAPSTYVDLLALAYRTIKSFDDGALVISAGLAPVGFTDNYNSIDTDTYLNGMLRAGAADHSDGIGAIFSASAVPPTLSCCNQPPGVDSHYESFLQYFGDLLAYYDQTLKANDVDLPVFVTQLGWGTGAGTNLAVPAEGYEWLNYTSEVEQALYVSQAYQIVQKLDHVAAMFLYNLNACAVADEEGCFFSLVDANDVRRPVFDAYAKVPKSAEES